MFTLGRNVWFAYIFILNVSSFQFQSENTVLPSQLSFTSFLESTFSNDKLFLGCTLQLFSIQLNRKVGNETWKHKVALISSLSQSYLQTNGIVVTNFESMLSEGSDDYLKSHRKYEQPTKMHHSQRCSVSVVILNTPKLTEVEEEVLKHELVLPRFRPPTIRNRDKYLILTEEQNVPFLLNSKLIRGLKFKLFMVFSEPLNSDLQDMTVSIKRPCQYRPCIEGSNFTNIVNVVFSSKVKSGDLFPDQEKNFFGYTLRLSTTTKVPQLLELEVDRREDGSQLYLPKRGLYAAVLWELTKRLNFTYEIVPSSGGGSTGHMLPNGTMVGIVGDTYRAIVDFGFMAATTYGRFPYIEFCAPINFAYLGFVTGPPRKSYTWKAILWPFNYIMWFGLVLTIGVASKLVSMSYSKTYHVYETEERMKSQISYGYLKGVAFLVRGLLEQCSDVPKDSPVFFKLFLTVWLFFCLVCSSAYRSKMVSLLTFPVYDKIPASFDELAKRNDFAIDFHYFGNVGYTYFKSSTNPSFIAILQRMEKEPSALKCLQRTVAEKSACITFILTYEELLHRNLSDQFGNSPLKFTPHTGILFPAGVVHEYKAPLSVNFQSVLFSGMETGLIPLWQQEDLNNVLKSKNDWQKANNLSMDAIWGDEKNGDDMLRVKNLQGAFVIFVVGMTASVIAFSIENIRRPGFKMVRYKLVTAWLWHFG